MTRALPSSRSRWLVVGTGRHVDTYGLPALVGVRDAEVWGVCGSDPERAAEIAARHGVSHHGTAIAEMIADPAVTHVYVASRNADHEAQVARAASHGKPVLCEKPLSTDAASARRIVEACADAGVALGTGFHLRHNAAHRRARTLIADGAIGEALRVEVAYSHAVTGADSPSRLAVSRLIDGPSRGIMAGTGAHATDLAGWLVDSTIVGVTAALSEVEGPTGGPYRVVQISGRTCDDILVDIVAGRLRHPRNRVAVTGTAGTLTIERSIGNLGGGLIRIETETGDESINIAPHDVYAAQFEDFLEATRDARDPDASGADGLAALLLVEAVEQALQTPFIDTLVVTDDHSKGECP